MARNETVAGVILAGGRSLRMGADKAFLTLGGERLIDRAIARLAPQVGELAISAGDDLSRFASTGLPVLPDPPPSSAGPLAGILAGLFWARELAPAARSIVTVPVDAPFFPLDLVGRLSGSDPETIGIAEYAGRSHPVFGVFPIGCAEDLSAFLERPGRHAIRDWLAASPHQLVPFPLCSSGIDPFLNLNTPADLAGADRIFASDPVASAPDLRGK